MLIKVGKSTLSPNWHYSIAITIVLMCNTTLSEELGRKLELTSGFNSVETLQQAEIGTPMDFDGDATITFKRNRCMQLPTPIEIDGIIKKTFDYDSNRDAFILKLLKPICAIPIPNFKSKHASMYFNYPMASARKINQIPLIYSYRNTLDSYTKNTGKHVVVKGYLTQEKFNFKIHVVLKDYNDDP